MSGLDPEMAEILALAAAQDFAPWEQLGPEAAKTESEIRNEFWNEGNPPVASVRDITIPGPLRPMRLRVYTPEQARTLGAGLLYIHGGGWVICSIETHDGVCRRLANASGQRVLSLDYVMAPEHPFPAPLEDVVAAQRWLHGHGGELGLDPTRVAIGGDSAGANLALAACLALKARGQTLPAAAVLIYGVYSADNDSSSHRAYGGGDYLLSTASMRWFWDQYVPDTARRGDPLASPLHGDLAGLPPLYVSAAAFDPLRDDSERLAERLRAAGADFEWHLWPGVTHACIMMSRMLKAADAQIAEIAAFLAHRTGT
jgi:acetyl esterase